MQINYITHIMQLCVGNRERENKQIDWKVFFI